LILPNWYPEDQLSFTVLQYHGLDEQQVKTKLSQFPRGTKLFFQMYKSGQIFPPSPWKDRNPCSRICAITPLNPA
jgi:hypothetical protein